MQRVILDSVGPSSAYQQHQHALNVLKRQDEPLTHLFSTYQADGSETTAWWTGMQGQAVPKSSLSAAQQQALDARYQQSLDRIEVLSRQLQEQGATQDAQALQALLKDVSAKGAVYSVGGKPLLLMSENPALSPEPLFESYQKRVSPLPPVSSAVPAAAAVGAGAAATTVATSKGRPWLWFLLAALLALLLALFLSWWFKWPPGWWDKDVVPVEPPAVVKPDPVVEEPVVPPAPPPEEPVTPVPEPEPEPVNVEPVPEPVVEEPPAPPPAPEPPPKPEPPSKPKPEPKPGPKVSSDPNFVCAQDEKGEVLKPEVYIIFDSSMSMLLSVNAKIQDEEWFFSQDLDDMGSWSDYATQRARTLFQGTSRIDAARSAFSSMVDSLPAGQDLHLVTFAQQCAAPNYQGRFTTAQRGRLKSLIQNIEAKDSTNLVQSLNLAASRVDGVNRDALIVLFVDGNDGCDQDICAVSRSIARAKPRLRINVVDITGQGLSACAATATGGVTLAPKQSGQIAKALRDATTDFVKRAEQACK